MKKHWTSFLWIIFGIVIGMIFGKILLNEIVFNNRTGDLSLSKESQPATDSVAPSDILSPNSSLSNHSDLETTNAEKSLSSKTILSSQTLGASASSLSPGSSNALSDGFKSAEFSALGLTKSEKDEFIVEAELAKTASYEEPLNLLSNQSEFSSTKGTNKSEIKKDKIEFKNVNNKSPKGNSDAQKANAETGKDFLALQKTLESLKSDFLKESNNNLLANPPQTKQLIERCKEVAKTADDYKKTLEIEKEFEQLKTQLFQKRQNHIVNEMQRIQLKYDELKAVRVHLPDSVLEPLKLLINDSKELIKIPVDSPELAWKRECLVNELNDFLKLVQNRSALFNALNKYDAVCLQTFESQKSLIDLAKRFPGTPYSSDFMNVSQLIEFYQALDDWNSFVFENANYLNRFSVPDETAIKAVAFYRQHEKTLFFIAEWPLLTQRMPQWTIQSKQIPIQERILKLVNHLSSQDYWLYEKNDQWHYLLKVPTPGNNEYQSDLLGKRELINISEKDIGSIELMKQNIFFRELKNEISLIDNSLRQKNAGQWYAKWGECLEKIRANNEMDPIVQFLVLKDICSTLAAGDFFFQKQLVPWLRILESSKFDSRINWFDASNPKVSTQREIAKELMTFLPVHYFEVNKTAQELDASIKPLQYYYQRVGWLDLDLSGRWFCRPEENGSSDKTGPLARRNLLFPEKEKTIATQSTGQQTVDNQIIADQTIADSSSELSAVKQKLRTNQESESFSSEEGILSERLNEESVIKPASYDSSETTIPSQHFPGTFFSNENLSGDLFVLSNGIAEKAQWVRVGQMNKNQAKIEIASSELKRGMPIFCRVSFILPDNQTAESQTITQRQ